MDGKYGQQISEYCASKLLGNAVNASKQRQVKLLSRCTLTSWKNHKIFYTSSHVSSTLAEFSLAFGVYLHVREMLLGELY